MPDIQQESLMLVRTIDYVKRNGLVSLLVFLLLRFYKSMAGRYGTKAVPTWAGLLVKTAAVGARTKAGVAQLKIAYLWPVYRLSLTRMPLKEKQQIIAVCDRILVNRFYMEFGYHVNFEDTELWHRDPITRSIHRVEGARTGVREYLLMHHGDIRLLWEVNRLQFVLLLAQGYALSGDRRYAEKAVAIVESWVAHNAHGFGPNWLDAQEVGIRTASLLISRGILEANGFGDHQLARWDQVVVQGAEFVLSNLSIARERHNHFMTELVSLFLFSVWSPGYRYRFLVLYLSRYLLRREIQNQLLPDGLSAEGSVNYTLFVYDAVVLAAHVHQTVFHTALVPPAMLERMRLVIDAFAVGECDFVKIGDADCGRYQRLSWSSHLSRLGLRSVVDSLVSVEPVRYSQEMFWLQPERLGASPHAVSREARREPCFFRDGGLLAFRSGGWSLFIRLGPAVARPEVRFGHMHSDFLSFCLYQADRPLFVDPGTFTYLGLRSERFAMRSASRHNSVTLDGADFLDVFAMPFGIPEFHTCRMSDLYEFEEYYQISGAFDFANGFGRVERTFAFARNLTWVVLIQFGESERAAKMDETYCACEELEPDGAQRFLLGRPPRAGMQLVPPADKRQIDVDLFTFAPIYGVRAEGHKLVRRLPLASGGKATSATLLDLTEGQRLNLARDVNTGCLMVMERKAVVASLSDLC